MSVPHLDLRIIDGKKLFFSDLLQGFQQNSWKKEAILIYLKVWILKT
jgi:hypothetical protein